MFIKLCSNGVHSQTLFSIYLKRLFLHSTSSSTSSASSSLVNYLVNSLGFSRHAAITASKKVRFSKLKSSEKLDSVLEFLKKHGLENTQIKKVVSSMPDLLLFNVDKTLEPKFNALQEMGIKGSDLADVIASNPTILKRGLSTRIGPMMNFLKSLVGTNRNFVKVLRRSYWLMSSDVAINLQPNMELLQNYGLSKEKILKMLIWNPGIFAQNPKRLQKALIRVEEEFGIPSRSWGFVEGVVLLGSLSEKTLESKYQIFKSFGYTESNIMTMVRKLPRCLMLSEAAIRERLSFFMYKLGCEPGYIVSRPYILAYSMETRVIPRTTILQVLKERKLITANPSVLSAVCTSEPRFLEQYVLPYKNKLPKLCEAYICRKKGRRSKLDGGSLVEEEFSMNEGPASLEGLSALSNEEIPEVSHLNSLIGKSKDR